MKDEGKSEKRQAGKIFTLMTTGTPIKGKKDKGGLGRKSLKLQLSSEISRPGQ